MIGRILDLLAKLIDLFSFIKSLLVKTPAQKAEDEKADLRKEIDGLKKTGRPPK